MSNRAKREGAVERGREADVGAHDRLASRACWFPEGIVTCALALARDDQRHTVPSRARTASQWFRELSRIWESKPPRKCS